MKTLLTFDNLANCYLFPNLILFCILPKQEHCKTVRNVGILILLEYCRSYAVLSLPLALSTEVKAEGGGGGQSSIYVISVSCMMV